jgi:hypothetical protein
MPAGRSTLSFTVSGLTLDSGADAATGSEHPPEAFEVSMLSSFDVLPLLGEMTGMAGGDALLNIQPDGTVHFAPGVRVEGAGRSGFKVDMSEPFEVLINLPPETAGETTTLMFDLVGFGEDASAVQISDVRLAATNGWQNPIDRYDVSGNGSMTPLDALLVINQLAAPNVFDIRTGRFVEITDEVGPPPFYDVNGDGFGTPLDALLVINRLARPQFTEAESVDLALADFLDDED